MIATTEETAEPSVGLQRGAIVFVEDNADDFLVARHHIRKLKIANPIQRIAAPRDLLDYISGRGDAHGHGESTLPAVFVIDLRLPGVTGLDVQAALRSNLKYREVPIIAISSPEQINALRTAVNFGAIGYMTKPFSGTDFARILLKKKVVLEIDDEF